MLDSGARRACDPTGRHGGRAHSSGDHGGRSGSRHDDNRDTGSRRDKVLYTRLSTHPTHRYSWCSGHMQPASMKAAPRQQRDEQN